MKRGDLRALRQISRINGEVVEAPLKTKNAYRTLPLAEDTVSVLRAGLPKVRFHDLQHTFATLALQNGVDIKTRSGMLGRFSAGFTLDIYTYVTGAAQCQAAQTMAGVLEGK